MIFKIILRNQSEDQLQDARVHCVVLKVRAVPFTASPPGKQRKAQSNQMLPTRRSKRIRSLRTQQRAGATSVTLPVPTTEAAY